MAVHQFVQSRLEVTPLKFMLITQYSLLAYREQKVYWTNVQSGIIRRINFDGTDVRLLASSNVTVPGT